MFLSLQDNNFNYMQYNKENVFTFSDFVFNSGCFLSRYYYNNIIEKIDNGYGFTNSNFNNTTKYFYSPEPNIHTLMSTPYITKEKWSFDIGSGQNSISINNIDINSGNYLYIYSRRPVYFCIYNHMYFNFNLNRIDYSNKASIYYINNNNINYLMTNWKTNKLYNYENTIYYGGLSQSNSLEIIKYSVNEKIKYYLDI